MTIAPSGFVVAFPEFGNATYPTPTVQFWLTQGYQDLNASRFGQDIDLAVMLFAAHNLVLGARNAAAAATPSGIVGQASGPLSSKSVGGVSASFDTGAVATEGAAIYNSTSYGQRLWSLMMQFGSGPRYAPTARGFQFASRRFGRRF